jgi:PAS domain S-box-containing protein
VTSQQILIVEDELVVATSIQVCLRKAGYDVPAIVSSGEEAIQLAGQIRPDLVLMDIRLQGEMLGAEAAEQIRTQFDIPVVYLTAYADEASLQRAKASQPFGYLVKPFRSEELRSTIEMALYKHEIDRKLQESELRYRMVSELTSDFAYCVRVELDGSFVIEWITDAHARITGYTRDEAMAIGGWQRLVHAGDLPLALEHLEMVLAGQMDIREFRIIRKDGGVRWLRNHARPVWDAHQGRVVRIYAAAQDTTGRRQAQEERERLILELQDALSKVKTLKGLLPICASCKKIRDDQGYWTSVEVYILQHSTAEFTHGICPECARKLYPDFCE